MGDEEWEIREIAPACCRKPAGRSPATGPLCGYVLGDDDEAGNHYGSRESAAERARENGWTVAENVTLCVRVVQRGAAGRDQEGARGCGDVKMQPSWRPGLGLPGQLM